MSNFHLLADYLEQIENTGEMESYREIHDTSIAIEVSKGLQVFIDSDPGTGKACFSSPVAVPDESNRLTIYELVLIYSNQWPNNDGMNAGLDEEGGTVWMNLPNVSIPGTFEGFEELLVNFLQNVIVWQQTLEEANPSSTTEPVVTNDESENPNEFIRI